MKRILKTHYNLLYPCVFILSLISNTVVFSQTKTQIDSSNFVFYPDKIMIRTNLSTQTDAQILTDKKGEDLILQTNNSVKLLLSVDYKFIGFSYGFYPKSISDNNDDVSKGTSKFSEYNLRLLLGKWVQTFEYSRIKGYYVENTSDFNPDWQVEKDPYIQYPNLKTVKYGMTTSYLFNPKFSLKSITSFTEWQKKSAGSFIPTVLYSYRESAFQNDSLSSSKKEYDIILGAGYFHNFIIFKRFYIAPNLTIPTGVKFIDSKENEQGVPTEENDHYYTINLIGGLKVGYNSENILFGANLNLYSNTYSQNENQEVSNNKYYFLLYFGYRFDAPKFISKPIQTINEKLHF